MTLLHVISHHGAYVVMAFGVVPSIACGLITHHFARTSFAWTAVSPLVGMGMAMLLPSILDVHALCVNRC
jgi:hypothetical protein